VGKTLNLPQKILFKIVLLKEKGKTLTQKLKGIIKLNLKKLQKQPLKIKPNKLNTT
jgi:hypothetical protein